jgi:hypothetical protein
MFYQFRPGSIIVTIFVLHPDVSCLLISPSVGVSAMAQIMLGKSSLRGDMGDYDYSSLSL